MQRSGDVRNALRACQFLENELAIGPGVLNDPFFQGRSSMGNPKITIIAYCLAIGFILAVAVHSSPKTLTDRS
jgi:hypothetical protein